MSEDEFKLYYLPPLYRPEQNPIGLVPLTTHSLLLISAKDRAMSVEQLEAEILKLPRDIRARLAERLISSLDDDLDIERAWVAESEERYQRHLEGKEESHSVDAVLAKLREEFGL